MSVNDIVQANLLAIDSSGADGMALNVGSGTPISVQEVATEIGDMLGTNMPSEIVGKYRSGDIRHCFADISRISTRLGYRPQFMFREGLPDLVEWLRSQQAHDRTQEAFEHLATRGLVA